MRILNTDLAELNISNEESIKETFKDFITESDTNSLTAEAIMDVFSGDDIKEVVLQKGTGTTFSDAISMISDASIGFNPLTAKRMVVMLSVRNEKISTLLRIMEKFKTQLKYVEKFSWGFTINPTQEEDYIVNLAEADLLDENAVTTIELPLYNETFQVRVKWREAERMRRAAKFINSKINTYTAIYSEHESEKRILLMAMLDMTVSSYSFEDYDGEECPS